MTHLELRKPCCYRAFFLLFLTVLALGVAAPVAVAKGKKKGHRNKAEESDEGKDDDDKGETKGHGKKAENDDEEEGDDEGETKRVGRGGLGGALGGMLKDGLKDEDDVPDLYGGPPYGDVGRFVRQKLDEGLKGHELAKAIHAYLQDRKPPEKSRKKAKKSKKRKKKDADEDDEAIGVDTARVISQGGNTVELGQKIEESVRNRKGKGKAGKKAKKK